MKKTDTLKQSHSTAETVEKAKKQAGTLPQGKRAGEANAKNRKKQGKQENGTSTQAQSAVTPKKAEKQGKKAKKPTAEEGIGVVPIPDLLPQQETFPVEPERHFDSNDILKRKYKRPEKKVIPSLASVSLLPTMELRETFGNRCESLEFRHPSKDIPDADATSRMFSQRKQIPEKFRSAEEMPHKDKQSKRQPDKKQAEKKHQENKQECTPSIKRPAKSHTKQGAKQEQRVLFTVAHDSHPATEPKHKAAAHHTRTAKNTQNTNTAKVTQPKQHVLRISAHMENPSHHKDSTEQKSSTKPYYLSERRR